MYIDRGKWPSKNGKVYKSVHLRESYREGKKVKKRNLANLTHCPPEEIGAIELALKHKGDLSVLGSLKEVELVQGPSVGAVYVLYQVAQRIGLEKALGTDIQGKLALWQVIARAIDQGSRLSAVRLAKNQAVGEVLGFSRGFNENDLYENLTWLYTRQAEIEKRLFQIRNGSQPPALFLYDVTSSYLEGDQNELGDYGYNRDRKKGKKQIVIGLLCDAAGEPVSTEVFEGNTSDLDTFASQVKKTAKGFGCSRVTFVGDRGMIKSPQIGELTKARFHYITAITKAQIRKLIGDHVLQMSLFDESVCEVTHDEVRYILRRNPVRAEEMADDRASKQAAVQELIDKKNEYLSNHPRAKVITAWDKVQDKIDRLNISGWLKIKVDDRKMSLSVDEEALAEAARLDGCYVLKTDLPAEAADKETIHARYKDLAEVEQAFRTCKTAHLNVRPVYVRKADNTRGHVLVVMLAYLIVRVLKDAWKALDVTVEEGLDILRTICAVEMRTASGGSCLRIPSPDKQAEKLVESLGMHLPTLLPKMNIRVDTHKKLPDRRK